MHYNEQIMLAVFEKFLHTTPERLENCGNLPYYIQMFENELPFDNFLIRWHIALLFDEFLLKQDIIDAVFGKWRFEKTADQLNLSGHMLYNYLKQKYHKI